MNRIFTSFYTPQKQDSGSPVPRASGNGNQGNDEQDVDVSGFSSGPKRTPIASKRSTPVRPMPGNSTQQMAAKSTPAKSSPTMSTPKTQRVVIDLSTPPNDRGDTMEVGNADGSESNKQFAFKAFLNHRWVNTSVEIQVEWEIGEATWEPEVYLHQDAPEALFAYWRKNGGRPTNPVDPEMFEVFAIIDHTQGHRFKHYRVEWVGYPQEEATWVSRGALNKTVPDIVEDYEDALKAKKGRK